MLSVDAFQESPQEAGEEEGGQYRCWRQYNAMLRWEAAFRVHAGLWKCTEFITVCVSPTELSSSPSESTDDSEYALVNDLGNDPLV